MASEDELFRQYLEEIERVPPLSRDEEVSLARAAAAGDDDARTRLVRGHLRLVVAIARRYRGTGVPLLDLVQEGNLGLMQAADGYDPDRGFPFTTFATWWIRQAIARSVEDEGGTIALGSEQAGGPRATAGHETDALDADRLQDVWDSFVAHAGRQPTLSELAADLDVPESRLVELLRPPRDLLGE